MEPDATGESEQASSEAARSGPGSYITLAEYDANKGRYASTDVVLFFNAEWCSTCKKARDNIEASLASIPADLTIVVVDFDTANDLRQKYGVTVQHTFVQVDADGNELAKWSGSVTADEIAQNTV
jgi:thiol-disulfide isomerase/thioredoxin